MGVWWGVLILLIYFWKQSRRIQCASHEGRACVCSYFNGAEEARRARVAAAKKEEEEIARVRAEALAKEKRAKEKRAAAAEDATIAATMAEL